MKKEYKKVNIHLDYVAYGLTVELTRVLGLICDYMQMYTPYGDEYKNCYSIYKQTRRQLDKFIDSFACCINKIHEGDNKDE